MAPGPDQRGQQGFWLRRIYFADDLAFSEKLATRFRVEANSNGQFQFPGRDQDRIYRVTFFWSW